MEEEEDRDKSNNDTESNWSAGSNCDRSDGIPRQQGIYSPTAVERWRDDWKELSDPYMLASTMEGIDRGTILKIGGKRGRRRCVHKEPICP